MRPITFLEDGIPLYWAMEAPCWQPYIKKERKQQIPHTYRKKAVQTKKGQCYANVAPFGWYVFLD